MNKDTTPTTQPQGSNYERMLEKRNTVERVMTEAYKLANALQVQYNEINEAVEQYEQEQSTLDQ